MRDSINQAKLTLQIENFLKRLKRRSTKWDGFYSQLTNLLLDFDDIYDPDDEYPVPAAMVPTIVQMILEKELRVLVTQPSDVTNDSKDDTQNIYSKK